MSVVGFGSHTAHMRPDEPKQVLLQLHFEFRWIVGFIFCAQPICCVFPSVRDDRQDKNERFAQTLCILRGVVNRQQPSPGTDWVALAKCASEWPVQQWKYKSVKRGVAYQSLCETSVREKCAAHIFFKKKKRKADIECRNKSALSH